MSVDPKDALDVALEVFRKTELGLQDAMILASAAVMGADALVSNDDDFKQAFNAGAGMLVWELAGKPLALLDHRSPLQPDATLHSAIVKSLKQRYGGAPWFGEPTHVDRRDGGWYLGYRHPWPVDGAEPALVPGRHHLSVMDAHSLVVCEVREMYFFEDSLPNGVTSDLALQLASAHSAKRSLDRHLRMPKGRRPGHIELAIPLAELPEQWRNWGAAKGARPHKRLAPRSAVAFVERPRKRL